MARRPPRTLSQEDRKLWSAVARTVAPARRPKPVFLDEAKTMPAISKRKPKFEVQDFRIGETARDTTPRKQLMASMTDKLAQAPIQMDHGTHKKMLRGKLKPDGRIDLHGMTLAQAHPALIRFIQIAHKNGKRLVLVITGKGKDRDDPGPIPVRRGVLKHQVPNWLHAPPLGQMVLDIREAHLRHGGTGAYYVYLRRPR